MLNLHSTLTKRVKIFSGIDGNQTSSYQGQSIVGKNEGNIGSGMMYMGIQQAYNRTTAEAETLDDRRPRLQTLRPAKRKTAILSNCWKMKTSSSYFDHVQIIISTN